MEERDDVEDISEGIEARAMQGDRRRFTGFLTVAPTKLEERDDVEDISEGIEARAMQGDRWR